ncbi:TPA: hypothetical protein ACH3X2_001377 [Trebouxia sp. C0005]
MSNTGVMSGVRKHLAPTAGHTGCFTSRLPARRLVTSHLARQNVARRHLRPSGSSRAKPRPSQACFKSTARPSCRGSSMSKKASSIFGDLVGQRFLSVASRRHGSKTIVAVTMVGQASAPMQELLGENLKQADNLRLGQLGNGLRYVMLPNKVPPQRFEAHLEMHAGSVDEQPNEQGIAHMVEHITFLGSKKRESLLGTGARSNAYTDFHHTVFHVHAPLINGTTNTLMLPQVLDVLAEVAFEAEFLSTRIEKERRAVMAEAQMMNTIEYRVDCQLLQYLHEENALGFRFPIGKMDQVETVSRQVLHDFWKRWYFPGNATLYLVGDFDGAIGGGMDAAERMIHETFGRIPPARLPGNGVPGPLKQRQLVRPPVQHRFGCGPLQPGEQTPGVSVFRHHLLQHFMLSLFCKLPVQPQDTIAGMRAGFMARLMLSILQFRINSRYSTTACPPFISIEMDHSDSAREGCTVSTLTVTAEPKDWKQAIEVAVQEVRRLQKYGVTAGELANYKAALMRDSEHVAAQWESVPSVDTLDYCMECLALNHTFMAQEEAHVRLLEVADSVTLEEVNAIGASVLSYISHYRKEAELLEEAGHDPSQNGYALWGPTRMTSIVACIPAFMDASGQSTGGGMPMQRGASLTTSEHIDPASPPAQLADMEDPDNADIPEGAIRFNVTAEDIAAALAEDSIEVEARAEVEVPEHLISAEHLDQLMAEHQPRFLPTATSISKEDIPVIPSDEPSEQIMQFKLSNGIKVNARRTLNEPKAAMLRMIAAGGRANNGEGVGPSGAGVVGVGVRTLNEAGTVGQWAREQVELFCISKLINCVLEPDEEWVFLDFHFAMREGGMQSVLELVHMFLNEPTWDEAAMERAKQIWVSHHRSLTKSLERSTADRVMEAMLGPERRFRDPTPEEIQALSLDGMRKAVMDMLHPENVEVNITGDFDPLELESLVLRYLGTVAPRPTPPVISTTSPQLVHPQTPQRVRWHLKDSDERACAYIAGQAPARWFSFGKGDPKAPVEAPMQLPRIAPPHLVAQANDVRRRHPLYPMVTLNLLTEIMNGRLFTTVRDSLGLTYDVNFEIQSFDRLGAGWFVVNVTSTPNKIQEAMDASLRVLRHMLTDKVTAREVLRARRTVLTRHETDLKDNMYWLGLLTHLQRDDVPGKRVEVLRDLVAMYEAATADDIYEALQCFNLDDNNVFTCIGVSGKQPPVLAPFEIQNAGNLQSKPGSNGSMQASSSNSKGSKPALNPRESANAVMNALKAAAQSGQLANYIQGGDDKSR